MTIANNDELKPMTPKDLLRNLPLPSLHSEGYPLISLGLLGSILLGFLWSHLFWVGLILSILCLLHFRKPVRMSHDTGQLVSPIDGVLEQIDDSASLPDGFHQPGLALKRLRIRNGFPDVQLILAPCSGEVDFAEYTHKPLFADGSFQDGGETRLFSISGKKPVHLSIHAPMLGKKLIEETQAGKSLILGKELGMGRLAGICDIYLPQDTTCLLRTGQHVIAGETALTDFAAADKPAKTPKKAANDSSDDNTAKP